MLPPVPELLLFLAAALALNFTPGADMIYSLTTAFAGGPRAGVAASLGIGTGLFVHVMLAGFGLAALMASHPAAYEALRWAGVLWLVWLAIQSFRQGPSRLGAQPRPISAFHAWRGGVFVNLLNPKTIVFILAFIPQFVDAGRGNALGQFITLGMIFVISSTIITGLIAGVAAGFGRMLAQRPAAARFMGWLSGSVMLGLAARLAFERR